MRRHPGRTASLRWGVNAFLVSAVVLVGLIALLAWKPKREIDQTPLTVYCAAGLKAPVEESARAYEEEYGVPVHLNYGPSETLLANIEIGKKGDLYIPADFSYIEQARAKALFDEDFPLAHMTLVLAVPKGNPKQIATLADLLNKDVTFVQANPDAAAVGKLTKQALEKVNQWKALEKKTRAFKGTVTEVATDLRIGKADAGIVWDATVHQFKEHIEAVPLDELKNVRSSVTLGVLKTCASPASALRFARYLSARDQGLQRFARHGYVPIPDGDLWAEGEPTVTIYHGAMLTPAIKETIREFAQREGIPERNLKTVPNGCGILVSQMKTGGERPDAFFSCDTKFMEEVQDLFLDARPVSTNTIGLVVHKGNPKQILKVDDLRRANIERIGVGDAHKCALGMITEETLNTRRVKIRKRVTAGSGDMLVNMIQANPDSLDAIIVYHSNYLPVKDKFDWIPITDIECATAVQPVAAGKESKHRHLMQRLIRAFETDQSKQRFLANGFQWKGTR